MTVPPANEMLSLLAGVLVCQTRWINASESKGNENNTNPCVALHPGPVCSLLAGASLRCLSVQLCGSVPSVWGTSSQLCKKMGDFTLQITLLYISCEIVSEGVSASVSLNSGQLTARLQFPLFLTPYPLSYTK